MSVSEQAPAPADSYAPRTPQIAALDLAASTRVAVRELLPRAFADGVWYRELLGVPVPTSANGRQRSSPKRANDEDALRFLRSASHHLHPR